MYIISVRDKGADDSSESCGPPDPNGFGSVRQKAAMQEAGSHPVHLLAWHIGSDMRCRRLIRPESSAGTQMGASGIAEGKSRQVW